MCRYGLANIGPLMADVAAVEEGGTIDVTVTTEHMEWPSERTTIRIEPMRCAQYHACLTAFRTKMHTLL